MGLKIINKRMVTTYNTAQVNTDCTFLTTSQKKGIVRLLTFNIQVGNNTRQFRHYFTRSWQHILPYKGRTQNLQKIATIIHNYDLVALQEADGGSLRSNGINQIEYLAKLANFPYWHQQLNRNFGKVAQHSNGLLSRFKPTLIEDHPLPGMRGRGAIFCRFGEGKDALAVIVMHLALRKKTRQEQLDYIYNIVAPYQHYILMGDMNAGNLELNESKTSKHLNLVLPLSQATYPSWNPKYCLDHILLSPELKIDQINVLQEPISDHLPIEVDIQLPKDVLENITQIRK